MNRSLRKAYEIRDAKIQFVSLVDKAANKRSFLITKQDNDQAKFSTYGKIIKKDAGRHYVTGIVYEPMAEDSQGNYMTADEITKAAYYFTRNGGNVDIQHSFEPFDGAAVVESWIAKADFEIDGEPVKAGTWLMTMEITDDDVWNSIEKGDITGFSMGGIGDYSEEDVKLENVTKSESTMQKAGKAISGKNLETLHGIRESLDAFIKAFEPDEEDPDKEKDELGQNPEDNSPAAENSQVQSETGSGAGANTSPQDEPEDTTDDQHQRRRNRPVAKGEIHMTVHELQTAITAAVAKAMDRQGSEPRVEEDVMTSQNIQSMVETAVCKALEPIRKQEQEQVTPETLEDMIAKAVDAAVTPILKARGLPTNLNNTDTVEKNAAGEHYLHGIL